MVWREKGSEEESVYVYVSGSTSSRVEESKRGRKKGRGPNPVPQTRHWTTGPLDYILARVWPMQLIKSSVIIMIADILFIPWFQSSMHRLTHLNLGQFYALDSITLTHSMIKLEEIKYIAWGRSHSQDSIQEKLRNQCF